MTGTEELSCENVSNYWYIIHNTYSICAVLILEIDSLYWDHYYQPVCGWFNSCVITVVWLDLYLDVSTPNYQRICLWVHLFNQELS